MWNFYSSIIWYWISIVWFPYFLLSHFQVEILFWRFLMFEVPILFSLVNCISNSVSTMQNKSRSPCVVFVYICISRFRIKFVDKQVIELVRFCSDYSTVFLNSVCTMQNKSRHPCFLVIFLLILYVQVQVCFVSRFQINLFADKPVIELIWRWKFDILIIRLAAWKW